MIRRNRSNKHIEKLSLHISTFGVSLMRVKKCLVSLPHNQFSKMSKSLASASAKDKLDIAQMAIFVFESGRNIMGKGENASQHFLLYQIDFQRSVSLNR